jgi:signal transduction histidine kinase
VAASLLSLRSPAVPRFLRVAARVSTQPIVVLITAAAFVGLYAAGLVGDLPLWGLILLLVGASVASGLATKRWGAATGGYELHARIGVRMAATTAVIYAIGWGPTLAIGYLVPAAEDLELSGSAAWRPAMAWSLVGMAAGQAAIALHTVPSYVPREFAQGLGVLSALGLVFVLRLLGTKTEANEHAEADLRGAISELERLNEELDVSNRLKSEFVAIASHELRTPLTSVSGFARVLVSRWDEFPDEERRNFTKRIFTQAARLERLVEDLLTLSRVEAGVLTTRPEDVDLAAALSTTAAELASMGTDIGVECPQGMAATVDPDQLHEILLNYLTNARKYGADPITVDAVRRDEWVEIRVRDVGAGVPEEFVPRLFDHFTRVEGNAGGQQGAGLGLAIVAGLAHANNGEVWYEPNTPQGSCFGVRVPHARADAPAPA